MWFSPAVRAPGAGRPEEMDASGNYPPLHGFARPGVFVQAGLSATAWQQSQQHCQLLSHPVLCMCLKSKQSGGFMPPRSLSDLVGA